MPPAKGVTRRAFFLLLALAAAPAGAEDWLLSAQHAAAGALIAGEAAPAAPESRWIAYESTLLRSELPSEGWRAYEEEDSLGTVVRVLGPDSTSGGTRATLTVRLVDRSTPGFVPAKQAVEDMRRDDRGRDPSAVRAMRVAAGLARIFEVTVTRRPPSDEGPALPETLHEYVAVIPRGEPYFVVRMISTRADYLDVRGVFARFLRELRPVGAR